MMACRSPLPPFDLTLAIRDYPGQIAIDGVDD